MIRSPIPNFETILTIRFPDRNKYDAPRPTNRQAPILGTYNTLSATTNPTFTNRLLEGRKKSIIKAREKHAEFEYDLLLVSTINPNTKREMKNIRVKMRR